MPAARPPRPPYSPSSRCTDAVYRRGYRWTRSDKHRPVAVAVAADGGGGDDDDGGGDGDGDGGDIDGVGANGGGAAGRRGAGTDAGGVGTTAKAAGRRKSSPRSWPLLRAVLRMMVVPRRRRRRRRSCCCGPPRYSCRDSCSIKRRAVHARSSSRPPAPPVRRENPTSNAMLLRHKIRGWTRIKRNDVLLNAHSEMKTNEQKHTRLRRSMYVRVTSRSRIITILGRYTTLG